MQLLAYLSVGLAQLLAALGCVALAVAVRLLLLVAWHLPKPYLRKLLLALGSYSALLFCHSGTAAFPRLYYYE